jgi:hypothetical protein
MIFRVTWPYYIFKTKEKKMIYGIKASFPLDLNYYPGDIEKAPKELERCLVLAKKLIEANANIHVTKTTLTVSLADYMPVQKAKDVAKIFFKRLADEKETK